MVSEKYMLKNKKDKYCQITKDGNYAFMIDKMCLGTTFKTKEEAEENLKGLIKTFGEVQDNINIIKVTIDEEPA